MTYPKAFLKKGKEKNLLNKHPWVFSGAIQSYEKKATDGDIFEICDSKGQYLATGYFGTASIAFRILNFDQRVIDQNFFEQQFKALVQYRKQIGIWDNDYTNIFRLVHAEGDHLSGLIADVYDRNLIIHAHTTGIAQLISPIVDAVESIMKDRFDTIFFNTQEKHGIDTSSLLKGNTKDGIFKENGFDFYINWAEGQKTGFFIDQRENRQLLKLYARGKKVLNTFCYSGAFSVYALNGGAEEVHSIDVSSKAMEWTQRNIELNSFSGKHVSECSDAFDYLKECDSDFEIIVLDPPAFTKHIRTTPQAIIGYRNLNTIALKKIKKGGFLFTFSCSQAIDKDLFRKIIFQAAVQANRNVKIVYQLNQSLDHPINVYHPEGEYLKGLLLYVE
ncbi:MAG TPA: class I SAM-dependent rRNA methyltransferase [Bacteroidia bacterium]|nr:class I SAM-dependent rRNA methyltransferase [Bacteroidia bacterium]